MRVEGLPSSPAPLPAAAFLLQGPRASRQRRTGGSHLPMGGTLGTLSDAVRNAFGERVDLRILLVGEEGGGKGTVLRRLKLQPLLTAHESEPGATGGQVQGPPCSTHPLAPPPPAPPCRSQECAALSSIFRGGTEHGRHSNTDVLGRGRSVVVSVRCGRLLRAGACSCIRLRRPAPARACMDGCAGIMCVCARVSVRWRAKVRWVLQWSHWSAPFRCRAVRGALTRRHGRGDRTGDMTQRRHDGTVEARPRSSNMQQKLQSSAGRGSSTAPAGAPCEEYTLQR